ncbi:hypothetical protein EV421DRAFT_595270 [Armillaria borealis]|uniref:Uncharacterized protein n=1 Tax=Armillaria borealis TaxID=47425 RepID=A0AA39JG19_9AGAR|nr:hypothetical protein EV421DRAFT_595270 [Armillaria borealis]
MTPIKSNLLPITFLALLVAVHGAPLTNITSTELNSTMQGGSITRSVEVITYHPTAAAAPLVPRGGKLGLLGKVGGSLLGKVGRKKPPKPSTTPKTAATTSTRIPTTSTKTPTTPRISTKTVSHTTLSGTSTRPRTTSHSPTTTRRRPASETPTSSLGEHHFSFYFWRY